ncbi:hypothetical protein ACQQ2Q_08270 [Agrobacterium sp. ES01]|uniref:hypothetical protein n=1 Tax=Agrobacterium sp. ES01 TaxID=3420714 RepID=UPI003D0EE4F9
MFIFSQPLSIVFCSSGLRVLNTHIATGSLPSRRERIYHNLKWVHGQVVMDRIVQKNGNLNKQHEKRAEKDALRQRMIKKRSSANALDRSFLPVDLFQA